MFGLPVFWNRVRCSSTAVCFWPFLSSASNPHPHTSGLYCTLSNHLFLRLALLLFFFFKELAWIFFNHPFFLYYLPRHHACVHWSIIKLFVRYFRYYKKYKSKIPFLNFNFFLLIFTIYFFAVSNNFMFVLLKILKA